MKRLIAPIGLIICASLLWPANSACQQPEMAPVKPRCVARVKAVDFTEYDPATGAVNMVVHLVSSESCGKLTVQLSPWNGTQVHGDTVMHEDLTGHTRLSFLTVLTVPLNDTSGIVVKLSDAQEEMEARSGKFGAMEFQRFFITTGDSLEVYGHPPWELRSMINKSKCDISKQEPFDVSLMTLSSPGESREVILLLAAWIGDKFRWEPIHVKLQPQHGVTAKEHWLWAHRRPSRSRRRRATDPYPVWVTRDSSGALMWTDREPNPGNRSGQITLSLAPDDTCYATLTTACKDAVAKINMKFVTTGDTTECWWAGPGEDFHPIFDWETLAYGQIRPEDYIQTQFGGYASYHGGGCVPADPRPFVGSFDFITLPAPNQVAEVVFTLEATDQCIRPGGVGNNWEIETNIYGYENQVQIVGDSVFIWPGPYGPGDTFTDTLRFIPLASGGSAIFLRMKMWKREGGIYFTWFLDSDGKLLYLGNPEKTRHALRKLKTVGTVFAEADSLHLRQYAGRRGYLDFFDCETIIKPLPRIGDTSYIHYKLAAKRDWETGLDYSIGPRFVEIVSYPGPLDFAFKKGDTIELKVGIVPVPAPGPHAVRLDISSELGVHPKGPPYDQDIWCGFVFSDDGKLRYANWYSYFDLPKSELPNFQYIREKYTIEEIVVYKNSEVYHGKRLVKPAGKP